MQSCALGGFDRVHDVGEDPLGAIVVDLAGPGRLVATATVGEHQPADVECRRAVDDRAADREHRVLPAQAPDHVHGDGALGMQRVDHEAVGRVDDLLVAEVEHDHAAVHRRAAQDLLLCRHGVLAVQRDALGDVRVLEDLLDAALEAEVDQLHHQLVVGDAELPEAAQTRCAGPSGS